MFIIKPKQNRKLNFLINETDNKNNFSLSQNLHKSFNLFSRNPFINQLDTNPIAYSKTYYNKAINVSDLLLISK